ncbi:hypothetical protein GCM10010502_23430 [Kitasatospora aureofaciens]|uniref:Uncharacterized protein n=1 Tax=Kitasatospora aureofaciens TaxID=1894 RepID=A0A8H9LQ78_KITAU|nr:hypothetical protein GCM10010502_23430 [Kitasatospora aureofaciens]
MRLQGCGGPRDRGGCRTTRRVRAPPVRFGPTPKEVEAPTGTDPHGTTATARPAAHPSDPEIWSTDIPA